MTIKELAALCGVSVSTVSKVLNGYPSISFKTKEKVYNIIREEGFIPSRNIVGSKMKKSNVVGILSHLDNGESTLDHPLFSKIITTFSEEMSRQGYDVVLIDYYLEGREASYLDICRWRHIGGVLAFGFITDEMTYELFKSEIPTICFDYYGTDTVSVRSNNVKAMEILTDYVLSKGHREIYFLSGDDTIVAPLRLDGFKSSLYKHGLEFNPDHYKVIVYYDLQQAYDATIDILTNHPEVTCIMYPDDYLASAGLKACDALGKRVPDDISITGFDGTEVSLILPKKVTTMKQDTDVIGMLLADHLDNLMNDEDCPLVDEAETLLLGGETVRDLEK
ncbi:MAG: LacI family transcriptional regulator [Coprobacillus sp.]|nr:LacI family transcriptional regulator [Coprobacillus sp.]